MFIALLLLAGLAQGPAEWHRQGMAHLAQGELPQARDCFIKAVELDPSSPALRINLGNVLAKLGEADEAIKQFQTALAHNPRQVSALFNIGMLYLQRENPHRALHFLEEAHRLSPGDDEILKHRILALVRAGSPPDIRRALETLPSEKCALAMGTGSELAARHSYAMALDQFRREKQCLPGELDPVLGEASALLAMGDPQQAIDVIHSRWREAQANKHARWIVASACERLGRLTEAFEHFAAVVDLDPSDTRARMALGLFALKAKNPQLSAKVFEDARNRFPALPEFSLGQALVAQASGDPVQAEQRCQKLLNARPDYIPARLFLAALHLDASHFETALQVLNEIKPSASPLLAHYLRAAVLFGQAEARESGDVHAAMQSLEAVLRPDVRFAAGHILLARYYRRTDAAAAERHLQSALKVEPDSWQAQTILAQLHRKQGKSALARAEIEKAEKLRREAQHGQSLLWQLFYGDPAPP